MRAQRSRGLRAPSPGIAGKETPFSLHLPSPPPSPQLKPNTSCKCHRYPAASKDFALKGEDWPHFAVPAHLRSGDGGRGLQQVGKRPIPKPKGQLCMAGCPCLPPACTERGRAGGERQERA